MCRVDENGERPDGSTVGLGSGSRSERGEGALNIWEVDPFGLVLKPFEVEDESSQEAISSVSRGRSEGKLYVLTVSSKCWEPMAGAYAPERRTA